MDQSILIVEDDKDIAALIRLNSEEITQSIHVAHDGAQAMALFQEHDFHLVILDVMLPDMSGFDVCRTMRTKKPQQSILMLTSKTSETDRVLGLELGADDYMTKPFSIRELQARIRAQLRKALLFSQPAAEVVDSGIICIGRLMIDPKRHQVQLDRQVIDVTSTEFDLVYYLAQHPNQVFSRTQLLDSVWGYKHSGYEHTVNSHINRLRGKLENQPNSPAIIETVWGVGYKLNPNGVAL